MTNAEDSADGRPRRQTVFRAGALIVYAILMAAVLFGLRQARDWSMQTFSPAQAKTDWQKFRDDTAKYNDVSPVQRRVPRSLEPPALVLMRDYFVICNVIAVVLTTALYGAVTFMVLGVLRGNTPQPQWAENDRQPG